MLPLTHPVVDDMSPNLAMVRTMSGHTPQMMMRRGGFRT